MNEQIFSKLNARDQELIAGLHGTEAYKALLHALNAHYVIKADHVLNTATDWENVLFNRGESKGAYILYDLIAFANKRKEKV